MPVVNPCTKMLRDMLKKFNKIEVFKCPQCILQVFQRRELGCAAMLLLQYNWFRYDQDKSTAVKVNHLIKSKESLTFNGKDYFPLAHCRLLLQLGDYCLVNNQDPIESRSQEDALAMRIYAYILLYEKETTEQHSLLYA